jgi:chromosome segregation ATPase
MADRKKGLPTPPPDGERAFAVVVEQLRGEFKVFGEALGGLRQQMTERFVAVEQQLGAMRVDLAAMRADLDEVKADLDQVKVDLNEVKVDLNEVKVDLSEVKVDLGLVKSAATTHSRELRDLRRALGNKVERGEVETIVEHVVARNAER